MLGLFLWFVLAFCMFSFYGLAVEALLPPKSSTGICKQSLTSGRGRWWYYSSVRKQSRFSTLLLVSESLSGPTESLANLPRRKIIFKRRPPLGPSPSPTIDNVSKPQESSSTGQEKSAGFESPRELAAMLKRSMTPSEQILMDSMQNLSDEEILSKTTSTDAQNIDNVFCSETDDDNDDDDDDEDMLIETTNQTSEPKKVSNIVEFTTGRKNNVQHVGKKVENPRELAAMVKSRLTDMEKDQFDKTIKTKNKKSSLKRENQKKVRVMEEEEQEDDDDDDDDDNNNEQDTTKEEDEAFVKSYPVRNKEEEELRDVLGAEGLRTLKSQGITIGELLSQRKEILSQTTLQENQLESTDFEASDGFNGNGYVTKKRYANAQERKRALVREREVKELLRQQEEEVIGGRTKKRTSINSIMEKYKDEFVDDEITLDEKIEEKDSEVNILLNNSQDAKLEAAKLKMKVFLQKSLPRSILEASAIN